MTDYQPRVGDRVRVVLEGTVTDDATDNSTPFGQRGIRYCGWGAAVAIEVLTPAEHWQPGDVVRNADDFEDKRAWMFRPVGGDDDAPWVAHDGLVWVTRPALPANLRLLVRDGQPVAQPQPERAHPQPGDVLTEEPPVGSVVRDSEGDEATHAEAGWYWSDIEGVPQSGDQAMRRKWYAITNSGERTLTLVRWGAEQ